jgi:serine protease AprX
MRIRLSVYDVAGRLIDRLVERVESPGEHAVQWDAGRLPSGTYFYRLEAGSEVRTLRAILVR